MIRQYTRLAKALRGFCKKSAVVALLGIGPLARDKNIALTTGEIPPAAKFYLGREELKDGNVLEIEFKTE